MKIFVAVEILSIQVYFFIFHVESTMRRRTRPVINYAGKFAYDDINT